MHDRKFRSAFCDIRQRFDDDGAAGLGQPFPGGSKLIAVVVDLREVVEHEQARRGESGEDQLDRVGEIVDARCDQRRLGLGHDRPQRRDGCARLQWNGNRAQSDQRDVDGGVVDAGEAQQCDAVAGRDRIVRQGVGDRLHPLGDLPVGDRLEAGEKYGGRSAGIRIRGQLDGSRAEGGAIRVAVEDGLDYLREPKPGVFDCGGDRLVGGSVGELRIRSFQVSDAAPEALLAGDSRHQKSSKIAGKAARRCA